MRFEKSTAFIFVACLILCAFPRAYAFQDGTNTNPVTLSRLDPDSLDDARTLPYFNLHLATGVEIGSRIGFRIQFHEHYSGEVFFGSQNTFIFGLNQHARAGLGVNWHSVKWPNLVFSLIDVTDWIPGRPDAVRPWNKPFQYNLAFLSAGYLSMQNPGVNGFVRAGLGYEFFRDNQGDFIHGFNSLILDAGIGITF